MNVNNVNPAVTSAPRSIEQTQTATENASLFDCAAIQAVSNCVETSTTARVGLGAALGCVAGAALYTCGLGTFLTGQAGYLGAGGCLRSTIGCSLGGAIGCGIIDPLLDRAADTAKQVASSAVVGCSSAIASAVECAIQTTEEPVPVVAQPQKSAHSGELSCSKNTEKMHRD